MTDEAGPTARALLTLELIQSSPGVTADRLAEKLEVSARAARRYVAILREAGIPIESVRGPYGGYRLGRGMRLPPLTFSAVEALGLVMAVLDGHHEAGDPTDPVGSALGKLIRALPEAVAARAEAVRRTTRPARDRSAARPDAATTTTLVQACSEQRRVCIEYRSESGKQWSTDVDPWAVVVRHGRWYLLCHAHRADATRAYRIDRIVSIDLLEQTFRPPVIDDPVGLLETHLGMGWEYSVELVIDAPFEQAARFLPRPLGVLTPVDEQTCRLKGSTGNPDWYAEQLAGLPYPYRFVDSPETQAAARAIGERYLRAAASP